MGVSKVGGIFVSNKRGVRFDEQSTGVVWEDALTKPHPTAPDVATQHLADELAQLVPEERLAMERTRQEAEPASLFGATEFKIRGLALKSAAKLYHKRRAQKKRLRRLQRDRPPLPASRRLSRRPPLHRC